MPCLSKSSFLLALLLSIDPGYTRSTTPIPAANAGPGNDPSTKLLYPQPPVAGPVKETSNTKQWLTKVTIGTQTFNLILDTGSTDLWVYSPNVSYADGVNVAKVAPHNNYTCVPDVFAGTNCSKAGTFDISYGGPGFGASGYFVHDQVNVAGAVVRGMPVEVATDVGNMSQVPEVDGILGMGFKSISRANPPQSSFMESLMPQLTEKLFTVDLVPTVGGNVANIEFGYINRTKANGNLSTTPVNKEDGRWKVDNISFIIGDPSHPPPDLTPNLFTQSMFFDTGGSNYIDVDVRVSQAYYNHIPGSIPWNTSTGGISYRFPCNATLPDLTLNIGNGTVIYRASLLTFDHSKSTDMCIGPLWSSSTVEGAVGNMGGLFFEYHFVVFNPEVPEISYAPWNGTYGSSTA